MKIKRIIQNVSEKHGVEYKTVEKEIDDAIISASKINTPLWQEMVGSNIPSAEEFCKKVRERVLYSI